MKCKRVLLLAGLIALLSACNVNEKKGNELVLERRIEDRVVNKSNEVIVKSTEEVDKQIITIAATADMHGRIYPHDYATDEFDSDAGYGKISTLLNAEREKNPNLILMDVGDTVQDNSAELFNDLDRHPMVEAMNEMNFDLWAIGNHEFNFEKEFIVRNINNFDGVVLSANIYNEKDGSYFVNPSQIYEINGTRVAIIGIIPPYVPMWEASAPSHFKGLEFEEVLESAQKAVAELEGKYDVLVGAFHLGREDNYGGEGIYQVAEAMPEFDIIFGGHEHALYVENVNGVTILEPGRYGQALAKADIEVEKIDGKWEVVSINAENIGTKEVEEDKEFLSKFEYIHEKSLEDASLVVGEITRDFVERVDYITGKENITTMPTSQLEDTAIIDLINQVQMYYADAEISSAALFNFGSNLKAGSFKKKDVAYIYKYTNTLMGVNITGENLLKYMEWSANYYNTWREGDVTISFNQDIRGYNYDMFAGVDYDINLSKEAGNRIENVTINGESIDLDKTYKLAVNNYRFGTLTKLGLVTDKDKYYDSYNQMQDAGRIRDLIIKYTMEVKKGKLIPQVDNNWRITGVYLDYPEKEEIFEKVRSGEIIIPTSADGRSKNVEALNISNF